MPEKIKSHTFSEEENEKLRKQYHGFLEHYDKMFPIEDTCPEDLIMIFNFVQAITSINVCFMEAVRRLLMNKGITAKQEMNELFEEVYEEEMKEIRMRKECD